MAILQPVFNSAAINTSNKDDLKLPIVGFLLKKLWCVFSPFSFNTNVVPNYHKLNLHGTAVVYLAKNIVSHVNTLA